MSFNDRIDALLTAIADDDSDAVERALQIYDVNDIVAVMAKRLLDAEAAGGGGGGSAVTISETDPGAIGAGQLWLRLDPTQSWAPMLYVRNQTDDGWEDQAGAGYLLGLTYYDDDGNVAATLSGSQYEMLMKAGSNSVHLVESNGLAALTGVTTTQLNADDASVTVSDDLIILKPTPALAVLVVRPDGPHANKTVFIGDDGDNPLGAQPAIIAAASSTPADAVLASPGWCALWYDDTNGAAKLKIKAKTADGTIVAGEIALT